LLKQQDILKEMDQLMESIPATVQMRSDLVVKNPNQKLRWLEYQIFPVEIRGLDIPQPENQSIEPSSLPSADLETKALSNRLPSPFRRIICEFKANTPGPDRNVHSAVVLTDWNGAQVARVLKESFTFRIPNDSKYASEASVEIILKQEQRKRGSPVQYQVLDRLVIPISKILNEAWLKFDSGRNEIFVSAVQSHADLSQQDLLKSVSQIQLFCNQIGVSLIDRLSREILFICLSKIYFNMINASDQLGASVYIGSLQFDNQMREALYPVTFFPKRTANKEGNSIPWLQAAFLNLKDKQNEGFINLPYLSVLLQETNFFVEEELVWGLYEFGTSMADICKPLVPVSESFLGVSISEYRTHPEPGATTNVYIRSFVLHPLALNLTFQVSPFSVLLS
jgi:hypothetical protein